MSKSLKYVIIAFSVFFALAIIIYAVSSVKQTVDEKNNVVEVINNEVTIDIDKAISGGEWFDITEEDKITLALSSETSIISDVKRYLQDNKIAIFFVYGGPFDASLKGNYIIATGFNEDGKVKVLYPDDNFASEWRYSFEGVIEFANKVMLFEM